jgi:hypothetical protein
LGRSSRPPSNSYEDKVKAKNSAEDGSDDVPSSTLGTGHVEEGKEQSQEKGDLNLKHLLSIIPINK